MVKKREFWGLYKYHQDDDTYQNHMKWVEMGGTSTHKGIDMPKKESLMTQKLSAIAKSEHLTSCLHSFPDDDRKFDMVIKSMPLEEIKEFCVKPLKERKKMIQKYLE